VLMLFVLHLNRFVAVVFMYMPTRYEHSQCAAHLLLELPRLSMICPANCSGRGRCDFTLSTPQCECFDRSDTSPLCLSCNITRPNFKCTSIGFTHTITPRPTEANRSSSIIRSDVAWEAYIGITYHCLEFRLDESSIKRKMTPKNSNLGLLVNLTLLSLKYLTY